MKYEVFANTAEKTNNIVSKILITLIMLISVIVGGMTSYDFFKASSYDLSSLLIMSSYFSIVLGIYVITMRKQKPALTK
jgi:hypothetical protein